MADWVSNRSPEQCNRYTLLKVWRFFVAGSQSCSQQPDAQTRRKTIARQNQITVPPFFSLQFFPKRKIFVIFALNFILRKKMRLNTLGDGSNSLFGPHFF